MSNLKETNSEFLQGMDRAISRLFKTYNRLTKLWWTQPGNQPDMRHVVKANAKELRQVAEEMLGIVERYEKRVSDMKKLRK